ncbi:MAG: hypothetical protein ACRC7Q_09245, partial [Plesiomonas shigelloides]
MLKQLAPFLLMLPSLPGFSAPTSCPDKTLLAHVNFDINSSYFDTKGAGNLNEALASSQLSTAAGHLLLELEFDKREGNADVQKYNLWLAQRRIERVKAFLSKGALSIPMASRIRTAGDKNQRTLTLSWCNSPQLAALPP